MKTLREERLENGLRIVFVDESNRYFGDYHRVRVVASIFFDPQELPATNTEEESFRSRAIEALGRELKVVKSFERMGVASAEVDKVRAALIDGFLQNALVYLSRPGYPRALVSARLNRRPAQRFYG